jgi:AAA+ ATPase superfamily predicted ATPase
MLRSIMRFVDREPELRRLDALVASRGGGLAVVFGRRRIGKTRLLVEWCRRHAGIYAVADQSTPDVQRRYLAEAIATRFGGFADVEYRDWRTLLGRLAAEARAASWRGPLVFDELPYWIASSPELASVLQRWIDHEARDGRLAVALAGSSQRMMQGLALDRAAPLYGRATELFEVLPLELGHLAEAFGRLSPRALVEHYAAWGGVPRYWELAEPRVGELVAAIDELVLDPRGALHREPDRLLLEEIPSALEVRPVLDAIGAGAHRVSEIASRIGRPATSLSRPLERLIELGLAVRDVPFGESPRASRRSLYRIADPFTRLWFRVVASHRAELVSGTARSRRAVLARYWDGLVSATWEQLCRHGVAAMSHHLLGEQATWKPASRWWSGNEAEWDVVAEDVAGERLLLGEAKLGGGDVRARAGALLRRTPPELPAKYRDHERVYAVFVPDARVRAVGDVAVVTVRDLIGRSA